MSKPNHTLSERQLEQHLSAGDTIREYMGKRFNDWHINQEGPFLPEYMTPENLAEHLTLRHMGFDTQLIVISNA